MNRIDQFEEPRNAHKGTRKRSEKTKGRKVRLDELKAAQNSFWEAFEWNESSKAKAAACKVPGHKGNGWRCFHGFGDDWFKNRLERYDKIYNACLRDGIL